MKLVCKYCGDVFLSKRKKNLCARCKWEKAVRGYQDVPGGELSTLGKLKDIVVGLDFENQPTHVIEFDPSADTKTMSGRNGDFEVITVTEKGMKYTLSLSNKSLIRQISSIGVPSRLEITRSGTSYDTKYLVKNLGPIQK